MSQDLGAGLLCILSPTGETVGTGFVVSNDLAVTCAHVVQAAGLTSGDNISLIFHATGHKILTQVIPEYWRSPDFEDVAFLHLMTLPEEIEPRRIRFVNRHIGWKVR
jgi:hypothetical protein